MSLAVQLNDKAGAWSGYWTGLNGAPENPNDDYLPGDIRGKATFVDSATGWLLISNKLNARNNKTQSGFKYMTVSKVRSKTLQGNRSSIIDSVPHYLEDGITIDYYEYTYYTGWHGGDLSYLGSQGKFGNGFEVLNNIPDLYGSGKATIYVSDAPYDKTKPVNGDVNCLWEFSNYSKKSGVNYGHLLFTDFALDINNMTAEEDRAYYVQMVKGLSDILLYGRTNVGWRDNVDKPSSGCDWKVDLDGTKNPNILIKWTPQEGIQEYLDNGYYVHMSVGVIGFTTGEPTNFSEFNILDGSDGSITTTYNDLLLKAQKGDDVPDFIQKITNVFAKNNIELRFSLNYQKENESGEIVRENTSICFARFSYTAERISKGILAGQSDDGSTVEWGGSDDYNNDSADTSSDNYNSTSDEGTNDGSDFGDVTDSAVSLYQLTSAQLEQFKNYLWGDNFIQDIKLVNNNPMENIVGIKRFPISAGISGSGSVVVGNVDTGVTANICSRTRTITKTISVPSHYNNFLDYAPYTSVSIYLPFVGVIEVDTNRVIGKSIEIKCSIDYVQGTCVYYLYDYKHCLLGQYSGICAIDSPVTGNNNAQVTSAYVMGGGSTAINLASGNVLSATMTALSTAQVKHHYDSKGSFNSACLGGANQNIVLVVDYPMYQNLSKFNHTKGRKCNLSKKISDLKGYTVFNDSIDLTGVGGTKEEIEELKNLMINGVYI